jgi:hypothetical protein
MFYEIDEYINLLNALKNEGNRYILVFDRTVKDIRDIADVPDNVSDDDLIDGIIDSVGSFDSIHTEITNIIGSYYHDEDEDEDEDEDDEDDDEVDDEVDDEDDVWDDEHI